MIEIFSFVQEEWILFTLLIALIATLFFTESKKAGISVSTQEATRLINKDSALVLDIREEKEFKTGHIIGSMSFPAPEIGKRFRELDKYKTRKIIVVCKMGHSSGSITKQLSSQGFSDVVRLAGGIIEWQSANLPLKKP